MCNLKKKMSFIKRYEDWLNGRIIDWDCEMSYLISERMKSVSFDHLFWIKAPAFAHDDILERNFEPHCQLHVPNCVVIPLTQYAQIYFENEELVFYDNTQQIKMRSFRGISEENPQHIVIIAKEDAYPAVRALLNLDLIRIVCVISNNCMSMIDRPITIKDFSVPDFERKSFKRAQVAHLTT